MPRFSLRTLIVVMMLSFAGCKAPWSVAASGGKKADSIRIQAFEIINDKDVQLGGCSIDWPGCKIDCNVGVLGPKASSKVVPNSRNPVHVLLPVTVEWDEKGRVVTTTAEPIGKLESGGIMKVTIGANDKASLSIKKP